MSGGGHREILGKQVTSAGDGDAWLAFFGNPTARGLAGVPLVTSDARRGLVEAISWWPLAGPAGRCVDWSSGSASETVDPADPAALPRRIDTDRGVTSPCQKLPIKVVRCHSVLVTQRPEPASW